jgi:rSAM/selenodomain-associated transferase 2
VKVSVVVPALNEAQALAQMLPSLRDQPGHLEVIVSDGGSTDDTARAVERLARLVQGARGRAAQMNLGAASSSGAVLLFLHADTRLPRGALDRIRSAVSRGCVGGCFLNRFHDGGWTGRLADPLRDLRARLAGEVYGDHALFARRDVFDRLGGFAPLPVMEDYDFARRLRRAGPFRVIPDRVLTSARRFRARGWVRQWWKNQRIKLAYRLRWNLEGRYD